jgi:hypothetical protein
MHPPKTAKEAPAMKSTILWALVALNALLLCCFIGRITRENAALAQQPAKDANEPRPRMPGDFVMISGQVTGNLAGVVYIVDTTNGYLGGMTYDDTRGELSVMPRIDLARAFEGARGARNQGRK